MKTIIARNVNDALEKGIDLIKIHGETINSRVGKTIEIHGPVATVYAHPWERVLINSERDANPFFHLMESLWILAGRKDVKFLCEFNKRMIDYSDDGVSFNAAYGYRLRHCNYHNSIHTIDQLSLIINILKNDPNSRQAVAEIWRSDDLFNTMTKDKACNISIVFRIRKGCLTMTVFNRSNDMVWGTYGANMVQFSMIQEYVAAHLNVPMEEYTQISNSYHVYTEGAGGKVWDKIKDQKPTCENPYVNFKKFTFIENYEIDSVESDLSYFFHKYDKRSLKEIGDMNHWQSDYFKDLILPVLSVYLVYKKHGPLLAMDYLQHIKADDWRQACKIWLDNRPIHKKGEK